MPIYQTPEQKVTERAIATWFAECCRCAAVELPALSPIDWYFEREGRIVALVEIKGKNHPHDRWPDVMIDFAKLHALTWAAAAFSVPAYYVVQFSDGVFVVDAATLPGLPTKVCGRNDRATNDRHPVILIPKEWFVDARTLASLVAA